MNTEDSSLSEREIDIIRLVATGASNKEIASALSISPNTVKVHLRNIFTKIGVVSRTEATLFAIKNQIVDTPGGNGTSVVPDPNEILFNTSPLASTSEPQPGNNTENIKRTTLPLWAGVIILSALIIVGLFAGAQVLAERSKATLPAAPEVAPQSNSRWVAQSPLPSPRSGLLSASFNNKIYLIGGRDFENSYRQTYVFNPIDSEWKTLADKPTSVSDTQAVVIQEKIFVPGGRKADGKASNRLEVYDINENQWQSSILIPAPLYGSGVAAVEGILYIFGGTDGDGYSDHVYIYDISSDEWSEGSPLPGGGRAFLSAAVIEGRIYLFGGENRSGLVDDVVVYIPAREQSDELPFETRSALPQPQSRAAAVPMASLIYLIGGKGSGNNSLPLSAYDTQLDEWIKVDPSLQPIGEFPAAAASGNYLHVFGGRVNGADVATHQSYQAIYTISIPLTTN